jgi:hypothetical protein
MSMLWKWHGIWCNCNSSVVLLTTSTHRESLNYVCVRDTEGAGIANGDIGMWFSVVSMHFLPLSFPCVCVWKWVSLWLLSFIINYKHATHYLAFHPLCFFIAKLIISQNILSCSHSSKFYLLLIIFSFYILYYLSL